MCEKVSHSLLRSHPHTKTNPWISNQNNSEILSSDFLNFLLLLIHSSIAMERVFNNILSLWLSGRASGRGIRRSEVRFLMGDSEVDKTKKHLSSIYYRMLTIGINDHFWDEVLEIEIPKRTTGLDVYQAYRETLLLPPPKHVEGEHSRNYLTPQRLENCQLLTKVASYP